MYSLACFCGVVQNQLNYATFVVLNGITRVIIGQTGYFQQPGSSTIQSAQLQQHQAGYGLQGNVFGTHNQSHTNAGLQSFNSHFLSTPIQLAAAINAQQFRSGLPTQYMKGVGSQQIGDQTRSQQLKSPGSQEVLSSVFNSGKKLFLILLILQALFVNL